MGMTDVAIFNNDTIGGNSIITVTENGNTQIVPEVSNRLWSQLFCQKAYGDDKVIVSLEPIESVEKQILEGESLVNDTWTFPEEELKELLEDDDESLFKLVDLMYNRISVFKNEETLISVLRYLQFKMKISLERAFLELEQMSNSETKKLVDELKKLDNQE